MPLNNQQPPPVIPARYFQPRPVLVQARQYDGTDASGTEIFQWVAQNSETDDPSLVLHSLWNSRGIQILTLDGPLFLTPGDWCVLDTAGHFFYYSPEGFEESYEPAPTPAEQPARPDPDPAADLPPG